MTEMSFTAITKLSTSALSTAAAVATAVKATLAAQGGLNGATPRTSRLA
jgi:hypothetical protein